MTGIFIVFLVLVTGSKAELIMTVNPEMVEPDFTPFFSVNCALLENEEAKVVSMEISRQTTIRGNIKKAPKESLATLHSMTPNTPRAAPGYERLTLLGQITAFETELGTYLKIVWPSPTVEDLGLYTCDATMVGELGQLMPLTASVRVTTADPVVDRLLAAVMGLEQNMDIFNQTLLDMQAQLDNVTNRIENLEDEDESDDTASDTDADQTSLEKDSETYSSNGDSSSDDSDGSKTSPDSDGDFTLLISLIEALGGKLDTFNSSLSEMKNKRGEVDDDVGTRNETEIEHIIFDRIMNYFTHGNSTFFLFYPNTNTDTYRAHSVCESKGLHLAEVNDEAEFDAIVRNIGPYIRVGRLVLVAGRRKEGMTKWRWQNTGQEVSFFSWGVGEPRDTRNGDCIALRTWPDRIDMVSISCTSDGDHFYFLCEDSD